MSFEAVLGNKEFELVVFGVTFAVVTRRSASGHGAQALVSFKKYMPPSSSLLQGKHLPFTPSPLHLNIFRLFVILSLTQLYRYTPEIFLFSTATFKYKYRAPLRRIGQQYSAKVAFSIFQSRILEY